MENELEKELKILDAEIKNKHYVIEIEKKREIRRLLEIDKEKIFQKNKSQNLSVWKKLLKIVGYN